MSLVMEYVADSGDVSVNEMSLVMDNVSDVRGQSLTMDHVSGNGNFSGNGKCLTMGNVRR